MKAIQTPPFSYLLATINEPNLSKIAFVPSKNYILVLLRPIKGTSLERKAD